MTCSTGQMTLRRAEAVGVALSRLEHPYGAPAEARCQHSTHAGLLVKRVPGYQRWLLENTEWVPVTGDAAGKRFRRPSDAWVDIGQRDAWLALPRVRLPKEARGSFEFASAQRPRVDALERALDHLAETFDDPHKAPEDIRRTALWLQQRLDRALLRDGKSVEAPWLLCRTSEEWTWSTDPMILDIPGIDTLDGLEFLPAGSWRGLRAAYDLKRASEAVKVEVRPGRSVRGTGIFDLESRAQLLAVLLKHGLEPEHTARRLALVRALPVAELSVEFSLNGSGSHLRRPFHLEVVRTPRRITSARLYYIPADPINTATLGREIAALLEEPEVAHTVALVLRDAEEVLADEAVSQRELAEAKRLLETARRRARLPEVDESDGIPAPSPEPHDEEPIGASSTSYAATRANFDRWRHRVVG